MHCVDELVKLYFRIGFHKKEIVCLLLYQRSVVSSVATLKRLCQKTPLFNRKKNPTSLEVTAQATIYTT